MMEPNNAQFWFDRANEYRAMIMTLLDIAAEGALAPEFQTYDYKARAKVASEKAQKLLMKYK